MTASGRPAPIPHSRPTRSAGDLEAIARVLESGHLAAGPEARALEEAAARSTGRRWAVAASSGLAALHVALLVLDARPGDRIAVPSYVCSALLNAVRYVGGVPVLADAEPAGYGLDPASPALDGVRAAVVPHLLGFPVAMGEIAARVRRGGGRVVEDCAMAAGATVEGRPAGAAGDVAVFSLYATKMATSGQGGLLVGDDPELEARARDLLTYDNREEYRVRYNYALTDLQAALGRLQWADLPGFVARRRQLAARYDRSIDFAAIARRGGSARPPADPPGGISCYFRYALDLGSARERDRLRETLAAAGIETKSPVFRPLHRYLGLADREFPRTARLQDGLLSIPIYPSLPDGEADRVIDAVNAAI